MAKSDAKLASMITLSLGLEVTKLRTVLQKCPLGTTGRIVCHRLRKIQRRPFQTFPGISVTRSLSDLTRIQQRLGLDIPAVSNVLEAIAPPRYNRDSNTRERFLLSLRRRDPDLVLRSLLSISEHGDILRSIPNTTFSEILRLLDPAFFVEPYNRTYGTLSRLSVGRLRVPALHTRFEEFVKDIGKVVAVRKTGGSSLGINDYSRLLECARAVGSVSTAEGLWRDMKDDGVRPNTVCYNHFMAVKCFPMVSDPLHRHKLRVIPYNIEMRIAQTRPEAFDNYSVGPGGVRSQVMELYDEMVSEVLGEGDANTFCFLMIAMGREGDMAGVKSILRKVWGVDVDALMTGGQGPLDPVKQYSEDSPLYPGVYLLWTVAHIFGSNNDIPTALRAVDFISRQYSIEIPCSVWEHLFEWTFVLAVPRYGQARQDGTLTGKLPLRSVGSLWETMLAEPYNVKPTMTMYDKYIKTLLLRAKYERAQEIMEQGVRAYRSSISRVGYSELATRRYLLAKSLRSRKSKISDRDPLIREMELARIETSYHNMLVRRWVRLLIRRIRKADMRGDWERRIITEIVRKWMAFMPEKVYYKTTGGLVCLNTGANASRHPDLTIN